MKKKEMIGFVKMCEVKILKAEKEINESKIFDEKKTVKIKVFGEEENRFSGVSFLLSLIHYPDPINVLVTCSAKNTIDIFDSVTFEPLKTHTCHSDWVRCLVPWDEKGFLSCSDDSTIVYTSFVPPFSIIKKIELTGPIYKMMKVSEDLLVCNDCDSGFLKLYRFYEMGMTLLHELEIGDTLAFSAKFIPSIRFPNSFYINTNVVEKYIKHIECDIHAKKLVLRNKFEGLLKNDIHAVGTFLHPITNNEMMVLPRLPDEVFCYEVEDSNVTKKGVACEDLVGSLRNIRGKIEVCKVVNNQFLICGTLWGEIVIFEILFKGCNRHFKLKEIGVFQVHDYDGPPPVINDIVVISKSIERGTLRLGSCTEGGMIHVSTFSGLRFAMSEMEKLAFSDLRERMDFVVHNQEEYVTKDMAGLFVDIVFGRNVVVEKCFKTLLFS